MCTRYFPVPVDFKLTVQKPCFYRHTHAYPVFLVQPETAVSWIGHPQTMSPWLCQTLSQGSRSQYLCSAKEQPPGPWPPTVCFEPQTVCHPDYDLPHAGSRFTLMLSQTASGYQWYGHCGKTSLEPLWQDQTVPWMFLSSLIWLKLSDPFIHWTTCQRIVSADYYLMRGSVDKWVWQKLIF